MKKTGSAKTTPKKPPELLGEYHLDYRKARPNRFAKHFPADSRMVVLDADVAAVFQSSETVNAVLRALIQTMPGKKKH